MITKESRLAELEVWGLSQLLRRILIDTMKVLGEFKAEHSNVATVGNDSGT